MYYSVPVNGVKKKTEGKTGSFPRVSVANDIPTGRIWPIFKTNRVARINSQPREFTRVCTMYVLSRVRKSFYVSPFLAHRAKFFRILEMIGDVLWIEENYRDSFHVCTYDDDIQRTCRFYNFVISFRFCCRIRRHLRAINI